MNEKPTYKYLEKKIRDLEAKLDSYKKSGVVNKNQSSPIGIIPESPDCQLTEKLLRDSEDKFRFILDKVPALIWQKDRDGTYIQVNKTFCDTHGLDAKEIIGKSDYDIFPPELADRYASADRRVIASGRPELGIEEDLKMPHGELGWSRKDKIPYFDDEGKVAGTIGFAVNITETKRAEQARRESEIKYRMVVEYSNELIAVAQDGMLKFVNPKAAQYSGYSEKELMSKPFTEFIYPDDRQMVIQRHLKMLQGENTTGAYALRTVDRSGEIKWVETSEVIITWEGKPAILSFLTDINERKQVEDALRDSEEKFRGLFENAVEGFFQSTPEGRFINVNPAFAKILGYSSPEEVINSITDIASQYYANLEDRKNYQRLIQKDGTVNNIEFKVKRKDGSTIWVSNSTRAHYDDQGMIARYEGIVEDITERKKYERALRQSEERYRDLFENVSDLLYFHDLDGNFIESNLAFKQTHGYDEDDFEIINVRDLMPEADLHKFDEYLIKIQKNEKDEGHFRLVKKDGGLITAEYKNSLVRDCAGKPIGVRGSARDITVRLKAEKERKQLETRLRQMQKMEAVGRMAGAVAHHYNNLLSVVMGSLEMAMGGLTEHIEIAHDLDIAMHATRRAAKLGSMMLAYLGQSMGRMELLDLSAAFQNTLSNLIGYRPDYVTLDTDLPDPGPVVSANSDQINQVIGNLLINALESMGEKPGTVSVSIRTVAGARIPSTHRWPVEFQPETSDYACLEVADSGCGIAKDDIEKLFDPFYSNKFIGRGLGLSVALGIVRAHGGCITVQSTPGRGSVFRVFLPLSPESSPISTAVWLPEAGAPAAGITVLLIEGDPTVRQLGTKMITSLDMNVFEARNGAEAVEVLGTHRDKIGCVLCDLDTLGMDGWQTLADLRKIEIGLPVVLISGYNEVHTMNGAQAERPQVFLGKPYRLSELRDAIARAMA